MSDAFYRIAICDDNNLDAEKLKAYVVDFLFMNDVENYEIDLYEDGTSLLYSNLHHDFIFLNVQLSDLNGMNIAQHFADTKEAQNIIFISDSNHHIKISYDLQKLNCLIKPIDKKGMARIIKEMLEMIDRDRLYIFDETNSTLRLYLKTICYIEVLGRKTYLHQECDEYISKKQLKVWESELRDFGFARSHNSFIINLRYVSSVKSNRVILRSGDELLLSRKYKETFLQSFLAYNEKG